MSEHTAEQLAQRWATMTAADIDKAVRRRLNAKIHPKRLALELDFNARLVTELRELRLWPLR